jgi:hypothetical protein
MTWNPRSVRRANSATSGVVADSVPATEITTGARPWLARSGSTYQVVRMSPVPGPAVEKLLQIGISLPPSPDGGVPAGLFPSGGGTRSP